MVINEEIFKAQPSFTIIFRNEQKYFTNNTWFISLNHDQLVGTPSFLKVYAYARKLKDALEKEDNTFVHFISKRELKEEEFDALAYEISEHESAYKTIARSNGSEMIELLEDYDSSDL
jgi:hypothetical protein